MAKRAFLLAALLGLVPLAFVAGQSSGRRSAQDAGSEKLMAACDQIVSKMTDFCNDGDKVTIMVDNPYPLVCSHRGWVSEPIWKQQGGER